MDGKLYLMNKRPLLSVVIPCFNEEAVLSETNKQITEKLKNLIEKRIIDEKSYILYVDDGSKDSTWHIIQNFHINNSSIKGLKLSNNKGHQFALLAGLTRVVNACDICISIDADLQDDIAVFDQFIYEYMLGNEVVYGVRKKRDKDSSFKRITAQSFYRFLKFMGVNIVYNHADYRLLSNVILNDLSKYDEVNLFLRGLIPLIGYQSSIVEYDRGKRFAGESKYPLKKMISFALDGITSFSIKPIRFLLFLSVFMLLMSLIIIVYSLYRYLDGQTIQGWTFLNISIWLLSGIQMFAIGVIGEYVGKSYFETKRRPRYFIEDELI